MKLLMWLLLAVLVYFAVRKNFRSGLNKTQQHQADQTQQKPQDNWADATSTYSANRKEGEAMLNCAHCQIYFPASEAVLQGEQNFCCQEHADLAARHP